jgi:chemotaxis protein MotA
VDLATLIGIFGAVALIAWSMGFAAPFSAFYDLPSILIVFGGAFFTVMIKFSIAQFLSAWKIAAKTFVTKNVDALALIAELVSLADEARKGGLLSLEGKEVSNDFLRRGIQLLVDGHDPDVVKSLLSRDKNQAVERHMSGAAIFAGFTEMGPAMGMIGTLVGLVAMLGNMDDPKSIGPSMAVALLTTLYGSLLANVFTGPMGDKLKMRAAEEALTKSLIIDALLAIQNGQNPRVIDSMLRNYLPEGKRAVDEG